MNSVYYDLVFLLPGKQFHQTYIKSWTDTVTYLKDNQISFSYAIYYNPIISDTRNSLFTHDFIHWDKTVNVYSKTNAALFGNTMICQKVIMIDDDMVWSVNDIIKLIESPYDVTVGVYKFSNNINISIAEKSEMEFLLPKDIENRTEPFPIITSGLGFVACTYDILKQISLPWFSVISNQEEQNITTRGEDFIFFEKLRGINASIYCDPTIKLGHMKFVEWKVDV